MMLPPPPGDGTTLPRSTAKPVIGRPSRGRLNAGAALREAPSADAVAARSPALDAVLPPPRGEPLSLPPRGDASPLLGLLPALRPPRDWSLERLGASARRGASNEFQGAAADPLEPDEEDAPDDEPPELEPLELEDPPPSPPRGADVPVVLPFDVLSWAQVVPAVKLPTATAIANVLTNLSRNITPPSGVRTDL